MTKLYLLVATVALAQDPFTETVLPSLKRDCQGCHGAALALSGLDLRTRESLLKGGKRGAAVVPGKASESLLLRMIEGVDGLQMPPGGEKQKLSPAVRHAFREWIDAGAPWKAEGPAKWTYAEADLWAFQPLRRFASPMTIDGFIDAKLRERGMAPASKADRRTLIQRVTVDLTGLRATHEEVKAFVADQSPQAWEKLVDRLLASPRYGERWGRHWLDVARYADSGGYSNDFERPNAWRYRDYVIRSFNADKPYDRFVREQIAGDELYPGDAEALIATGFLRGGPWEHTAMSVEAVTRQMFLDDVTHATASTFLGLTLGCARCHDHKFDPLPTRDYYRMQAVFASTEFARPALPFLPSELVQGREAEKKALAATHAKALARMADYRKLAVQNLLKKHGVAREEDLPKGELAQAMNTGAGLEPLQFEEYKLFQKHAQIYKESLDRFAPKAFAVSSGPRDGETDGGPALRYAARAKYVPAGVRILPGGNVQSPAEAVTPGVLSAPEIVGGYRAVDIPETVEGRRSALANWIAHPENPLTARVMVNRVWQYHFGQGLAGDASNFGKMGKKPTHPELLDWLARSFIERGWSVKQLHRQILLSRAYQRGPAPVDAALVAKQDPDNLLLSYFSPRRLEAEALRDNILAAAGELSFDAGGPGTFPQISEDVASQPRHRMGSLAPPYHPSALRRERNRRSVYLFQQRSLIDPFIDVFNGPSLDLACERRVASTVPTQSFTLFNGQFAHDAALALAARAAKESPDGIRRTFELAYARDPEASELTEARNLYARSLAWHRQHPAPKPPPRKPLIHRITSELTGESFSFQQEESESAYEANLHPSEVTPEVRALSDVALALLNANEFSYVY
ncbi:MAG: PSD1 and planctomycete cytochrome C domain-containing protein [Bryobacteraceae bacterium]|nr:PSD1 and planctomycete cytochrome C domain-containing protein [Bryobacteraceae bacterium]